MKIGSLVELKDNNWIIPPIEGEVYPVTGVIYTIREIRDVTGQIGVLLEEITNPFYYGLEVGFLIIRFRELQPPMEISEELFSHAPETCEV